MILEKFWDFQSSERERRRKRDIEREREGTDFHEINFQKKVR